MSPSARRIIELNIEHYRELLKSETDAVKRRTVAQLLARMTNPTGRRLMLMAASIGREESTFNRG
jgi:hypothetical protein